MFVKILRSVSGFPAILYNYKKVAAGQAELLSAKNFGMLAILEHTDRRDFKKFMDAVASLSERSYNCQFHAVLSLKGTGDFANHLHEVSHQFMQGMGYAQQPYLVFYHKDTPNEHVHIVSTPVKFNRTKIVNGFDRLKAQGVIQSILGIDLYRQFLQDINGTRFNITEMKHLLFLLKRKGYKSSVSDGQLSIYKYRQRILLVDLNRLTESFMSKAECSSVRQRACSIIERALHFKSNECQPMHKRGYNGGQGKLIGFRSDLSDFLKDEYQIEVCYHFSGNEISGFTLLDHKNKHVFSGEEIIQLNRFVGARRVGDDIVRSWLR